MKTHAKLFIGAGTALVTPFMDNGQIDFRALRDLIIMQLESGIDFLVPCGTTGESPTLSHEEQKSIIDFCVRFIKTQIPTPILAGTGSNSTKTAIELTEEARRLGVDGVLVVSPYYNKPTQQGIKQHYREISKVGLPVILYDIPGRCGGSGVSAETILELAHEGIIQGLKWASGDWVQLNKVLINRPEHFTVLSGDDIHTSESMNLGADGVISVISNLLPEEIVELVLNIQQNESQKNQFKYPKLLKLMEAMTIETNPIPIKTALAMVWPDVFSENFRLPLCGMERMNKVKLRNVLRKYGPTFSNHN